MRIGFAMKPVPNVLATCMRQAGLGSVQIALRPYVAYNNSTVITEVVESWPRYVSPPTQWIRPYSIHTRFRAVWESAGTVVQRVLDFSGLMIKSLPYLATAMFIDTQNVLEKLYYSLNLEEVEDLQEGINFCVEYEVFSLIFRKVLSSVQNVSNVKDLDFTQRK